MTTVRKGECGGAVCHRTPGYQDRRFIEEDRPDLGEKGTVWSCGRCSRIHILSSDGSLRPT